MNHKGIVDIIGSAAEVTPDRIKGRAVAVIDVFRATSVMCEAIANGAKKIIPVTDVQTCHQLKTEILRQSPQEKILLGGERKTYKIEGFDLDNSPLAYTREMVQDATIIMSTTNGTRTINAASAADHIFIASFLNATAVTQSLAATNLDITIICAGRHDRFTIEDGLCAGLIALQLQSMGYALTDYAWTMADIYERYSSDIYTPLAHCEHYNYIRERLYDDIQYCLSKNILNITPKVQYNEHSGYQDIRLLR